MRACRPFAALLVASLAGSAAADPVVVELFTSQGCSSCPPADKMLAELAGRDGVIALSLHVDYWDWIGWKDTFGHAALSDRQRAYAAAAGSSVVYTPQFVIGGTDQIAGADGMAVADRVRAHQGATGDVLGRDAAGRLTMAGTGRPARLSLILVQPDAQVAIERGENAGREAVYRNVVRDWRDLGAWDGAAGAMEVPPAPQGMRRVVLAQEVDEAGHPGAVIGAATLD